MRVFISLGTRFLRPNHIPLLFVHTVHDACQAVRDEDVICLPLPIPKHQERLLPYCHCFPSRWPEKPFPGFSPHGICSHQLGQVTLLWRANSLSKRLSPASFPSHQQHRVSCSVIQRPQDHSTSQMAGLREPFRSSNFSIRITRKAP